MYISNEAWNSLGDKLRDIIDPAISSKLGRWQWDMIDLLKRTDWEQLGGGTEIFTVENEPVLWFEDFKIEPFLTESGPQMRLVREYKKLYMD